MSILGSRTLSDRPAGGDGGLSRAKKLADLYVKQHTDNGVVTDPAVYDYVNENILAPFSEDLGVRQKMAAYSNSRDALAQKKFSQDTTVGQFEQEVNDAIFSKGDTMRDPATMATYTSIALDNAILGVDAAIDDYHKSNQSADSLIKYRAKLSSMADAQRTLVNKIQNGTLPPNLDGFGYFVRTNPVDGSVTGAALLPVDSAPSEFTSGMKRIGNTVALGTSAKLPVYLPAFQGADGSYQARLNGNVWNGSSGDAVLEPDSKNQNFRSGSDFSLADSTSFPIRPSDMGAGGFSKQLVGSDNGNPVYSFFYKGNDNKVYRLDDSAVAAFKADPYVGRKLNGYVPVVGPDEVRSFGSVAPMSSSDLNQFDGRQTFNAVTSATSQAQKMGLFPSVGSTPAPAAPSADQPAAQPAPGILQRFFGNKNRPNVPNVAPQGDKGAYSTPDVINSGEKIFRNVA